MRSLQLAVGMNFGAKQYDRVIRATKIYILGGLIILVPLYLIVVLNPEAVLRLMFDSVVSPENLFNFIIFISVIPLLSITMNGMMYFPSIGNGKIAGLISMLRQVILYIPDMIFLPRVFGVRFVYIGSFIIDAIITIAILILMLKSFSSLKE